MNTATGQLRPIIDPDRRALQRESDSIQFPLDALHIGVVELDASFNIRRYNLAARQWFDLAPDGESQGRSLMGIPSSLSSAPWVPAAMGAALDMRARQLDLPDHSGGFVRLRFTPTSGEGAGDGGLILTLEDVTDLALTEQSLGESQARFRAVAETLGDAFFITSPGARDILYASPSCRRRYGLSIASVSQGYAGLLEAIHADDRERVKRAAHDFALGLPCEVEFRIHTPAARQRTLRWRGNAVREVDGTVRYLVGVAEDVTEQRVVQETLRTQALTDPLTGLTNREVFVSRLHEILAAARVGPVPQAAVLFLDLDHFKEINDTRGHSVGDHILVETSHRLRRCTRRGDTVARFGGDEFAILLDRVPDVATVSYVTERIHEHMAEPFVVGEETHHCTTSVGVALIAAEGGNVADVLRDADVAMYAAKARGPGNTAFFDLEMRLTMERLARSKWHLRSAITRRDLYPCYQPIVDLATGAIAGFEALARWRPGSPGASSPEVFIKVAEKAGLIADLERLIWEQVAEDMRAWEQQVDLRGIKVSINTSPAHLATDGHAALLLGILERHGVDPQRIAVEVTETALMENPRATHAALVELRKAGMSLALDDFGTGYSSLSHLCRFPIDILKIDRVFIDGLAAGSEHAHIVEATLSLARALRMTVTAEGIEDRAQHEFLRSHQCPLGQGYLFSPAVSAEAALELLRARPQQAAP